MSNGPPRVGRRTVLATGAVSLAALAGCSTASDDEPPSLERVVVRSDTGETERLQLTLVHAPREGSTVRPLRGVHEAPGSDEPRTIDDFEGPPGFYSLTVALDGQNEVKAFNSYGNAVDSGPLQLEVVVQQTGDLWLNLNEAGDDISVPG